MGREHVYDALMLRALRALMPLRRPPLRLYRGASARTTEERLYGMSWTMNLEIADRFARSKQSHQFRGGGVLLETLAPPTAIVCRLEYHPSLTDEEREELRREVSGEIDWQEFNDETEHVVDGGAVDKVEIMRRYPA